LLGISLTLSQLTRQRYLSRGRQKSSYGIRFYLGPCEYAWVEPAYFAVNVLENTVTEVNEDAIRGDIAVTHSDYVFFPMCRSSFRPKSYACPIFPRWHQDCPPLARIFGFWPFSVGHPDSVVSIRNFDRGQSFLLSRSPRTILILTSRRGAGATSPTCFPEQGGIHEVGCGR